MFKERKKIIQVFIRFLKNKKLLQEYDKRVKQTPNKHPFFDTSLSPRNLIIAPFAWDDKYPWLRIHKEWINLYYNLIFE